MKRILFMLFIVFALALPAIAQEAEPIVTVAPDNGQLAAILITVVLLAVLATIAYLGRPLIIAAAQSAPPVLVSAILAALDAVLARLQVVVAASPSKLDDEALAALQRELAEIRGLIEAPPVAPVQRVVDERIRDIMTSAGVDKPPSP